MLTSSTNHSKNMEKIADVVEASLGVAIVAARVKELNEFLAEILWSQHIVWVPFDVSEHSATQPRRRWFYESLQEGW